MSSVDAACLLRSARRFSSSASNSYPGLRLLLTFMNPTCEHDVTMGEELPKTGRRKPERDRTRCGLSEAIAARSRLVEFSDVSDVCMR